MCEKCKQQEIERAYKALRVNGDTSPNYYYPKLLAASAMKPTLHIKRLRFAGHNHNNIQLRMASSPYPNPERIKEEKEKAEKAMGLNYGF